MLNLTIRAEHYWYDMADTHELLGYRSAYDSRRILDFISMNKPDGATRARIVFGI